MTSEPLGSATRIAFGRFLAKMRRLERFSRRELAEASGISIKTVGAIERGERRVLMLEFFAICQALEVDAADTIRRFEEQLRKSH